MSQEKNFVAFKTKITAKRPKRWGQMEEIFKNIDAYFHLMELMNDN